MYHVHGLGDRIFVKSHFVVFLMMIIIIIIIIIMSP